MQLINEWILVEPIEEEEKVLASGLIVPKSKESPEKVKLARVIQISNHVRDDDEKDLQYDVGDVLMYFGKTGIDLEIDGRKLQFLRWDGMVAIANKTQEGERIQPIAKEDKDETKD